ncbi:glycosyltransferase [Terriglobus albidus]|uniref:glycosyltransferase n=1 Tax=Terriglobus albidus TaxID=1592106 RepID=UPI0021E0A7AF|nr:glycosyltransferase [Terriglobus albidus]
MAAVLLKAMEPQPLSPSNGGLQRTAIKPLHARKPIERCVIGSSSDDSLQDTAKYKSVRRYRSRQVARGYTLSNLTVHPVGHLEPRTVVLAQTDGHQVEEAAPYDTLALSALIHMKKVLHILSSLQRSGMEMMLLCSYPEWIENGYKCDILATASDRGILADDLQSAGYSIHHLPFRGRLRYLPSVNFMLGYWRLCRSGYDIVHIHTEAATPLFALIAKLAGVGQLAITPHNTFRFAGVLRLRKYMERAFLRRLGAHYGMISEDVSKCEEELYNNRGTRTVNWYNSNHFIPGAEIDRSKARELLQISEETVVIVSVGNCNNAKNHEALLRAIPLLPADIPIVYFHLGKEPAENPERGLAVSLGIIDRVQFMGTQKDPLFFFRAADIFVMPSLWEGMPISAIEAIAAGVPSVLANVAGLREVASYAKNILLVTPEPVFLAQGIQKIATMAKAERLSKALEDSNRIRTTFSIQNGVKSVVVGLYNRI